MSQIARKSYKNVSHVSELQSENILKYFNQLFWHYNILQYETDCKLLRFCSTFARKQPWSINNAQHPYYLQFILFHFQPEQHEENQ